MAETALGRALRLAGKSGDPLYILAVEHLRKAGFDVAMATKPFVSALDFTELQIALLGEQTINAAAVGYLRRQVTDMKILAGGDQSGNDALLSDVPVAPVPVDEVAGQPTSDVRLRNAPSSSRDGTDHSSDDTQWTNAPAAREPSKAAIKAMGKVHTALAKSLFDRKVGGIERRLGSICRFDLVQDERKAMRDHHIRGRLLTEIQWPNDETPLEQCASEAEVRAIFLSADLILDRMGMTNANR